MFSKYLAVMSVVLLPVWGMSAQAASTTTATEAVIEDDGPSGTDCFFQDNRTKPECQGK